jgi:hypothetical protein
MTEKRDWKKLYLRLFADNYDTLAELKVMREQHAFAQDALNNALREKEDQREAKMTEMREKSNAIMRALRAEGARDVLVEILTKERAK